MATFPLVGAATDSAMRSGSRSAVAEVDTSVLASNLVSIRNDLSTVFGDESESLALKTISLKLALSAEGKVAFIAKGAIEASIEVVFEKPTKH